jgi:protein disulfide-isomerase A6
MNGIIKVAAVNCDEEREIAGEFGIKGKQLSEISQLIISEGFPTIKIFADPTKSSDSKKLFNKKVEDYQGQRTASSIANFAVTKLPSFVSQLKASTFEKFM